MYNRSLKFVLQSKQESRFDPKHNITRNTFDPDKVKKAILHYWSNGHTCYAISLLDSNNNKLFQAGEITSDERPHSVTL